MVVPETQTPVRRSLAFCIAGLGSTLCEQGMVRRVRVACGTFRCQVFVICEFANKVRVELVVAPVWAQEGTTKLDEMFKGGTPPFVPFKTKDIGFEWDRGWLTPPQGLGNNKLGSTHQLPTTYAGGPNVGKRGATLGLIFACLKTWHLRPMCVVERSGWHTYTPEVI